MLYHDHAQSLYVEHKLPRCTSCSGTLAYSAKTPKQIYLSMAGKGLKWPELPGEYIYELEIWLRDASVHYVKW